MHPSLTPVLVVDDQRGTVMVISEVLARLGFQQVETASDGSEALRKLEVGPYGLVIADWHMNAVGGLQLLRHMRSHDRLASVPFIMITADPEPDLAATARQTGADAFLLKPFNVPTLRTKIEHLARRQPPAPGPLLS